MPSGKAFSPEPTDRVKRPVVPTSARRYTRLPVQTSRPALSAVIPTLGRQDVLAQTLESLLAQTCEDHEIIVVDQSETPADGAAGALTDRRVRYFHVCFRGSPAARNFGIDRARSEIVFSGDDDILACPDLLRAHLECYADPRVGGVAGRVLTREDRPLRPEDRVGAVNWLTAKMTGNFHAGGRREVLHVQGSNCSFRRSVLREVGGFDKAFTGIGHFEEADLSLRVIRAGWKLVFEPRAEVQHLQYGGGGNRPQSFDARTFWHFHNYGVLFRKHFGLASLPVFVAYQGMRALGYAVRERQPGLVATAAVALARGLLRPYRW